MSWFLSCIGCGAKNLPDKVESTYLDFQHCSLTSVPPYIFDCERCLEELYLDYNQITDLPKELFHCHELQILSLSDNDLHNLPTAVSSLSNLISLDLSKNGIADIPDSIKGCKKLRKVNASTNPLCRLPEGFTQLVALKELCLGDTFLEYLPANFGRLIGLEVLELRENQLNTLPRSMTRLTALKKLDLGQNEFTELPEVVGHLSGLTDLWLDNNRVKRIPPEIGNLHQLTFIDASKNRIQEIDPMIGNCKSLTDLFLTSNDLEMLPDSLCVCTKMNTLHVDDNRLEYLPENIGAFEQLVELKASHNELSTLPSSVGLLRSLEFLHIDDNVIKCLPLEIGSCASLVVLTSAHNELKQLPPEMGNLTRLRVLNLCGNSIINLPVSFSKLKLTALWLSTNQAKPAVPLQCILDDTGSQKVLTCFMLPQGLQRTPSPMQKEDRPLTEEEIEARQARSMIHFASDGDREPPGRLSRIPTPYPKELRALAKHTKNIQALKKNTPNDKNDYKNSSPVNVDKEMIHSQEMKESTDDTTNSLTISKLPHPSVNLAATIKCQSDIKTQDVELSKPASPIQLDLTLSTDNESSSKQYSSKNILYSQSTNEDSSYQFPVVKKIATSTANNVETSKRGSPSPTKLQTDEPRTTSYDSCFTSTPTVASHCESYAEKMPVDDEGMQSTTPISSNFINQNGKFSQRPGSLALEGSLPPWKNDRPGSLAAPINTIGLPLASPAKRAFSQSVLYGTNIQQNHHLSWMKERKCDLPNQTNTPNSQDIRSADFGLEKTIDSTTIMREGSNHDINKFYKESHISHFSSAMHSMNESKELSTQANQISPDYISAPNRESDGLNINGNLSCTNESKKPLLDVEKATDSTICKSQGTPTSKAEHVPSFMCYNESNKSYVQPQQSKLQEIKTPNKDLSPSFIAFSESGTSSNSFDKITYGTAVYSKIPHLKDMTLPSSTGILSPQESSSIIANSKVKLSSQNSNSGLPQKSGIPMVSPVSQAAFKREISKEKEDCVDSSKFLDSKTIAIHASPMSQDMHSKGSSRIPAFISLAEPKSLAESTCTPKKKESNIPLPGKSLFPYSAGKEVCSPLDETPQQQAYQFPSERAYNSFSANPLSKLSADIESGVPLLGRQSYLSPVEKEATTTGVAAKHQLKSPTERESNIPLLGKKPYNLAAEKEGSPGFFGRKPYVSALESQIQRPSKLSYGSPTDAGSHIPVPNPLMSPVEKPINQTGIPIISPSERSTRIPTFANSSLKGRKSGGIASRDQKSPSERR